MLTQYAQHLFDLFFHAILRRSTHAFPCVAMRSRFLWARQVMGNPLYTFVIRMEPDQMLMIREHGFQTGDIISEMKPAARQSQKDTIGKIQFHRN